jgi:tRNA G18 (ribose-2'-O)-methylase SpoU
MLIPITLILHDIRSTYNVGSILRSAECFGVTEVYFSGYTPFPKITNDQRLPHIAEKIHNQIAKTALGAETKVTAIVCASIEDAFRSVRSKGYIVASLEQDAKSIDITTYTFLSPTALVLGNEVAGVPNWTKRNSDVILEIKQYGTKESLNVASATAIALFAARL